MSEAESAGVNRKLVGLSGNDIGKQVEFSWADEEFGIDHVIRAELCGVEHSRGERVDRSGAYDGVQVNTSIEIIGKKRKRQKFHFPASLNTTARIIG